MSQILLVQANSLHVPLADQSVHCIVTSPPYWGLRSYGIGSAQGELGSESLHDCLAWARGEPPCGQSCYICTMRAVAKELWRVLHPMGVMFINISDTYASSWPSQRRNVVGQGSLPNGKREARPPRLGPGLREKSLCGIPQRLALALQADGWVWRSDIIWEKPSCMPESAQDRPTRSHEYVLLFAKQAKYFWDAVAIAEDSALATSTSGYHPQRRLSDAHQRTRPAHANRIHYGTLSEQAGILCPSTGRNARTVWTIPSEPLPSGTGHYACVDEETECLAATGWKRWDHLRVGEQVAQWNMHTRQASWGTLQGISTYDVANIEMVCIASSQQDQLLTPDHKSLVYGRQYTKPTDVKVVAAAELTPRHRIPVATSWDESQYTTGPSPEWAELIGWYVAEGYRHNHIRVEIYQSEYHNPLFCTRIESLLQHVEANYEKVLVPRMYRGIQRHEAIFVVKGFTAAILQSYAPGKAKQLSWDCLQWPTKSLQGLLFGLVGGDGHARRDGRNSFVQRSRETIDLVQAIALRVGLAATLSPHAARCHSLYMTSHRTTRSLRGTNGKNSIIGTTTYTGMVWCPSTPLGTWIARRNGKVCITGNSFPTALAERMILAGTSAHGVCGQCGAPWARLVERQRLLDGHIPVTGAFSKPDEPFRMAPNGKGHWRYTTQTTEHGWRPTCPHPDAPVVPATVLDPFAGSGTTLLAARALGRQAIGLDLSWPYLATIARERLGLAALARWHGEAAVPAPVRYDDLPLFA